MKETYVFTKSLAKDIDRNKHYYVTMYEPFGMKMMELLNILSCMFVLVLL